MLAIAVPIPEPTNYKQRCSKVGPTSVGSLRYCDAKTESSSLSHRFFLTAVQSAYVITIRFTFRERNQ